VSKRVPYIPNDAATATRAHLPSGPTAALTPEGVVAFLVETDASPGTRLRVLSILRTHSANGAEMPASILALVAAASGGYVTSLVAIGAEQIWVGLAIAVGTLLLIVRGTRDLAAAHVRRLTAVVWLRAYEDGMAERGAGGRRACFGTPALSPRSPHRDLGERRFRFGLAAMRRSRPH